MIPWQLQALGLNKHRYRPSSSFYRKVLILTCLVPVSHQSCARTIRENSSSGKITHVSYRRSVSRALQNLAWAFSRPACLYCRDFFNLSVRSSPEAPHLQCPKPASDLCRILQDSKTANSSTSANSCSPLTAFLLQAIIPTTHDPGLEVSLSIQFGKVQGRQSRCRLRGDRRAGWFQFSMANKTQHMMTSGVGSKGFGSIGQRTLSWV